MRNLILLSILFILLDISGSWIPIYLNRDHGSVILTFNSIFETIGFRLFFAFWYWIIGYLSWIIINICISFVFPKSITRSIVVSALVPVLMVLTIPESIPVVIWYCILSASFGFMFHKYVDIKG
jgi:hypothetical protein